MKEREGAGGGKKRRQTLTSPFVLSSEQSLTAGSDQCNAALCYCLAAALPSVFGVRCHKQCNTIPG